MSRAFVPGPSRWIVGVCLAVAGVGDAVAQCAPVWLPGDGVPGIEGAVLAMCEWDPDGAGPTPTLLVAAGAFTVAGTTLANNIAAYDPTTGAWSALGSGTNNSIVSLAVLPTGDLVAAGPFTIAGGMPIYSVARWNGTNWLPFASGPIGGAHCVATLPNGDLVVGVNNFFSTPVQR